MQVPIFCPVHKYGNSHVRMQRGKLEIQSVAFIPPSRHIQELYAKSCLNKLLEGSLGPRHTTNWALLSRQMAGRGGQQREAKPGGRGPPVLKGNGE